jgi:hypothetical protein
MSSARRRVDLLHARFLRGVVDRTSEGLRPWAGRLLVLAAIALIPRPAHADTADDLLQKGKDLIEKGRVDEGCVTLGQAEALQPTVDSMGLVAACHEKQGKLASAYHEYMTTADRAARTNDDRQKFALDQAAKLEARAPRILVKVAPGDQIKVTIAGATADVSAAARGTMVDPGAVTVAATGPSGQKWSGESTVRAGDSIVVQIPPMSSWPGAAAGDHDHPRPEPSKRYASGPPPAAIITGVIGLAGLGVLGGGGIAAIVLNNRSKDAMSTTTPPVRCSLASNLPGCAGPTSDHKAAGAAAIAADVGVGVGAAGIVASAFLWGFHVGAKVEPDTQHAFVLPTISIDPSGTSAVGLRGAF